MIDYIPQRDLGIGIGYSYDEYLLFYIVFNICCRYAMYCRCIDNPSCMVGII